MASPLVIGILAGGQSVRMGRDKALLALDGEPLLLRVGRIAQDTGLRVAVAGRERPGDWPLPDVAFHQDLTPGLGPLGGLVTLFEAERADVLVIGCDMPLLKGEAISWLREAAQREAGPHGLAVTRGALLEPLFSFYRLEAANLARVRLAEGRRSLHGLIEAGEFTRKQAPPHVARQLDNINTPEQWESFLRERGGGRAQPDRPA